MNKLEKRFNSNLWYILSGKLEDRAKKRTPFGPWNRLCDLLIDPLMDCLLVKSALEDE